MEFFLRADQLEGGVVARRVANIVLGFPLKGLQERQALDAESKH
jgi:hypothetical protein